VPDRCLFLTALALTLAVANGGDYRAQTASAPTPCPASNDTLSLLQPQDSAYSTAPKIAAYLQQHGFSVHCITRSTSLGTAGLWNVAGFQTDRGTITVLVLPRGEDVLVSEQRTGSGYRYTFTRSGAPPRHYVVNVNGKVYYLKHGQWIFEVWDPKLAAALRAAL